jgi:hypothetical protein
MASALNKQRAAPSASAILCLLSNLIFTTNAQTQLTAYPSPNTFILAEESINSVSPDTTIDITSDLPVTIQRYSDQDGQFVEGGKPVSPSEIRAVVTSDCDSTDTSVIPTVELREDGTVYVNMGVSLEDASSMAFLEPTWYDAIWSYASFWCYAATSTAASNTVDETLPTGSDGVESESGLVEDIPVDSASINRYCGKNWNDAYLTCPLACPTLDDAVCTNALGAEYKCQEFTACHERIQSGEVVPAPLYPPTATTTAATEVASSAMSVSSSASSTEAAETVSTVGAEASSTSSTGAASSEPGAANVPSFSPTSNLVSSVGRSASPSLVDNTSGAITVQPSTPSVTTRSPSPTMEEEPPTYYPTYFPSSSSPRQRAFSFQIVSTLMAILLIAALFSGCEGGNLFGYGKFVVAAVAITSFVSKSSNEQVMNPQSTRSLQGTCNYNVELLVDGCYQSLNINAPSARVLDVVMQGLASSVSTEDECINEYSANLTFPVTDGSDLDLSLNTTVNAMECMIIADGRPFVDTSGSSLQAAPELTRECDLGSTGWSGEALLENNKVETHSSDVSNSTNQYLLGEEWTQRALGEHASVASFSSFSIALMTNRAPSNLVEDALNAGLDEVRHARTSFEIASKLIGKEISPGSLPASKHNFSQDITTLALNVAREGCVDETLSAFVAALEIEDINDVLENDISGSKYSNVDRRTLVWIGDELKSIAIEESNHSALAWRTLQWACGVDSAVCEVVQKEVFDGRKLDAAISRRFAHHPEIFGAIKGEWGKIYNTGNVEVVDCSSGIEGGESFLTYLANNIVRGILCKRG